MKNIIILYSYHHNNTEKIAKVFAKVLDAQIKTPEQIDPEKLLEYDLIGFGSGIYGEKITKHCLILLINYHKYPKRKHSFSQPVH